MKSTNTWTGIFRGPKGRDWEQLPEEPSPPTCFFPFARDRRLKENTSALTCLQRALAREWCRLLLLDAAWVTCPFPRDLVKNPRVRFPAAATCWSRPWKMIRLKLMKLEVNSLLFYRRPSSRWRLLKDFSFCQLRLVRNIDFCLIVPISVSQGSCFRVLLTAPDMSQWLLTSNLFLFKTLAI